MNLLKQWIFTTLVLLFIFAPLNISRSSSLPPAAPTDEVIFPTPTSDVTEAIDVTQEAVIAVTPEATPVVAAPDTPPAADPNITAIDQILKIAGLIVAGVIGGSLLTVAGVIALIRSIRNDPEKMAMIERLYESRPDTERARIRTGVELAKEMIAVADEATDSKPLSNKQIKP